jgi:flagellar assembly protein FliH
VKRSYLPAEVEALVARARLEAREAALAEVESLQAMAVVEIGRAVSSGAGALTQIAQAHRVQSAELALAAGRILSTAALDRFPAAPLEAALEALGQEIDASPRLVVRSGGLDDATRARIEAMCVDAGFSGLVAFRDEPGLPAAGFVLEWADGRAEFDPEAAAARMAEALAGALAAEGGHAENLTNGSAS